MTELVICYACGRELPRDTALEVICPKIVLSSEWHGPGDHSAGGSLVILFIAVLFIFAGLVLIGVAAYITVKENKARI